LRFNYVAEDFFTTLGIPVLAGREIRDSDSHNSARVAVVNQTLADRYLSGANPIGHHLVGWFDAYAGTLVVGLVRDSKYESTDEGKIPMAWFSYQQGDSIDDMDIEVRTAGDPLDRLPEIQRAVREIDPNIPLSNPQVLSSTFEESYHMNALYARLAVFFGCLAALLVAVGLNGMLAYRVHRRTPEIGIRIALGATRVQVLWMILRDSLCLVAIGLAIGLPLAWFTSRLMATMLYQLSPHDPLSFALSALGVLIVSVGAALIPARRAAAVEPMRTLRME
jgi:predicted permease